MDADPDREFDAFWRAHHDPVVRSLTLAFADRHLAEDAAQVGFERALRKWRMVARLERPATWVYVVAVRHGRRHLAREGRRPPAGGTARSSMPEADDPQAVVADVLLVDELLGRLTPRQRSVVVLRHLADLPLADVADALAISIGTVKSTLHDAYSRLRVDAAPSEPARAPEAGAVRAGEEGA